MIQPTKGVLVASISLCPIAFAASAFEDTLTGNWNGHRDALQQNGIHLDMEYTNVLQSSVSGTDSSRVNNSHRFDLLAGVDSQALGLWQGGRLNTQFVARGGDANDFGFTSLSAPNSGQYGNDDSAFLSSFYYSHQFSSTTNALLGKIDAFELMRHAPFYGGATRHGFMNIAFSAPPSGVTPPSFFGAIANHSINNLRFTAMVYDPRDRYTESLSMSGLFDDGINLSLSTTYATQWLGRASSASIAYTYSTEEGSDYRSLDPSEGFTENARYKYNARLQLSHNLVEDRANPANAWGVYLRGSIADGNPNILDATFAGGLGGSALFFHRPMDNWGIGYYYYDLSNDLQDSISNLPIQDELQNEKGIEAYYAYQATPWLTLTADVQYVTPAISTQDSAWLVGLRTNIRF